MPRRISRIPLRGRSPRRLTQWGFIEFGPTTVSQAGTLVGSFSAATLASLLPFTLVRIRGLFLAHTDQSSAVETFLGSLAWAVVSEDARAAGVASLPTPINEGTDDRWLSYHPFAGRQEDPTSGEHQSMVGTTFEMESKAMRKLGVGDSLVLMGECSTATLATVAGVARLLFKLH